MIKSSSAARKRWGGSRKGAGRRAKSAKTASQLADLDLAAAQAAPIPEAIETVTQPRSRSMVDQLVNVMRHGKSDTARLNACNKILDRGYGKPSTDAAGFQQLPLFGAAISAPLASEIRDRCRLYATEAVLTLQRIAEGSESESARVAAASSIIDRAAGSVAVAKLPEGIAARTVGKKEAAALGAKQSNVGVYATPQPPRKRPGSLH